MVLKVLIIWNRFIIVLYYCDSSKKGHITKLVTLYKQKSNEDSNTTKTRIHF